MTIARLQKVTLCGLVDDKEALLQVLQDAGCVHLVPLRAAGPLEPMAAGEMRRGYSAYRYLSEGLYQLRPWPKNREIDVHEVIDKALNNKRRLREARDRRDFLSERIAGLENFGDFVLPPDDALRGMKLWFYVLPSKQRSALVKIDLPWQIVGRDHKHIYLVLIAREEPPASVLPVPRVHTGSESLSALRDELERLEIEIEDAEVERAEIARSRLALGIRLAQAEDADDRRAAARMTLDDDRIFALQGWVPTADAGRMAELADAHDLAVQFADPQPGDSPPTLLENPGTFSGASALTTFYTTPGYRSWDPSLIVLFSFAIFFAMILADAAYALILGAVVALLWRRMGRSAGGRQARIMLAGIVAVAFVYGVLAGAYFGVAPPKGTLLARMAIIDVQDFQSMMRVSIVVGVLQIALANAEVAWRNWGSPVAIARIGWIVALLSGIGVWLAPSALWHVVLAAGLVARFSELGIWLASSASRYVALPPGLVARFSELEIWLAPSALWYVVLAGGLVLVVLGSAGERSIQRPRDWLLRAADGFLAITHVTKLFGDVLSYMRLFALGLASASLATTFNALAGEIAHGLPGIGILFAILVLLFGHSINIALGILSGVVHGLRLNYIEFFGWALAGEGQPFKAFAHRSTVE